MKIKLVSSICFFLFICIAVLFIGASTLALGCSVSVNGVTQHADDGSWPYWAEGNVTSSIGFSAPENVTFYHFTSALSKKIDSASSEWLYIGGCSPLDFGDFSGNLPDSPFDWYISYLNEGTYKLEIGFYCEYMQDSSELNCSAEAESIFTVADASSSDPTGSLTADFSWTPDPPTVFDTLLFQSTSQVTEGYITSYYWYLDDTLVSSGSETWQWASPTQGFHTIRLEVTDSNQNSDSISFSLQVGADEWFVIDAATGSSMQTSAPWDLLDRSQIFQYGDDIIAWAKIGNISKQMTVDMIWTGPDFTTVRSISKSIEDPNSYGYSMWESYTVWDNITTSDALYDTVFSNPGSWSVSIYVDGSAERVLDFTIASDRDLNVTLDKMYLITGEKLNISGMLTDNDMPVDDTRVTIEIYKESMLQMVFSDLSLDEKGGFSVSYVIPVLDDLSGSIQDWSVVVSTDSSDPQKAILTETCSFHVLPVVLDLVDVKLVQIIETPDFSDWGGSYPYLALNRPAAVRVMLRCPSWTKEFSNPEIMVSFTQNPFVGASTTIEEKTIQVTDEITHLDFLFTPSVEGSVRCEITVDPYHEYADPLTMRSYLQSLEWQDEVIVKQMKSLMLRFIPVDIPSVLDDPSQLDFIKKQMDFIRDVYPIPKEDITFRCCYRYDTQVYERSKWTLINLLSTKNLLGNYGSNRVVLVGITPQSWWDPGDQGMALGRYITGAVIIKNDSTDPSVTGHEVGHTMGLRTWTEEYDLSNYYQGRFLDGLILKDNKIVNLSIKEEYENAFPNLINLGRRVRSVTFYCMMGNAHYSWICEEDYVELFNALKDPPNDDCVLMNGWVHPDGSIDLGDCFLLSECSPDQPFAQGEFTLEIRSSSDEVLYTDQFGMPTDESDPFSFLVPWFDEAARILITKDETIVQTLTPSQVAPEVILTQPQSETYTDTLPVSWESTDSDGDDLTSIVFYSHDQTHWDIINTGVNQTSIDIDTRYLPGGSKCQIKIMVTDGFHVAMVESRFFSVDKKQPICSIINDSRILGIGYDLEDGELSDTALSWYSDSQGYIGDGDHIPQDILQSGTHMITLKATDADGNTAEDTVEVIISQNTSSESVSHVFCLGISEYGDALDQNTVFSSNETLYSLVTFDEIVEGDQLNWVFTGPDQQQKTASLIFESSGAMYGYAPLDLNEFNTKGSTGIWTVDVYLNDALVSSETFMVKSDSSDTPLGLEIMILSLCIILFWLKRKDEKIR